MVKKKSKKSGKKEDAPEEKDEIAEDQNEKGGEELPEEKEVSEDQDEREVDELSEEKKGGKDDSDEKDEAKGRLVVSQRERDEIDAVVDAFWAFIDATKKAPKLILLAGIFLTVMGASFAGWPQNAFDLEVDDKSGVWLLITSSDYEMSRGSDGYYANFEPDDSVWVEGELNEIQYYGPIEKRLFPTIGTGEGDPSVAPGDGFRKIEKSDFGPLFSSFGDGKNDTTINYVNGENIMGIDPYATNKKEFSDVVLDSALFSDVDFKDVIFSNLTLNDTFFVDCTFERVSFHNVDFNRAVFSNGSFDTVLFDNISVENGRFDNNHIIHLWVKDSTFNHTIFDKTDIFGSKWSYSSLENGKYQRGNLNVVIFRSLVVNNFALQAADIKNVLDVPNTATFDFTYMTVGKTEIKVNGNIEDDYPLGQNMLVSAMVGEDGVGAGIESDDGGWVGDVSGEGFGRVGFLVKENLSYEYMIAQDPEGASGLLINKVLRMEEGGVDTT
ncbi:MAG: pentapeptide repeat-containing protein, partial [Dehalococcoidia bacterium]|nr:pentapeptide repeat-containing protein [Dehalococcoidia bacterium]